MDAEPGLIYPRAPTWARLAKGSVRRSRMEWQPEGPFRLQFYRNGHSWLAGQPTAAGIGFAAADDACVRIDDWQRALELAYTVSPGLLHRVLDRYAAQCCPVREVVGQTCHRSLLQVEYATDPVFGSAATLRPLDEQPTRQSVLSVETEQIASFLGRQITPQLAQEPGSQFSTRIEGTCIKHRFGEGSSKMYDKSGQILRIEPTTGPFSSPTEGWNIGNGRRPRPRQESIYSLIDLREIRFGCNRRDLEHLSALDDFSAAVRALDRLTRRRHVAGKTVKGINSFGPVDNAPLQALQDPRVNIAGIRRAGLLPRLDHISPARLSRQLRRLRDVGVIK